MQQPFEEKFAECWPVADWVDVTVLVGVSGGPDSMALLRALTALRSNGHGRLVVVHFNHRLRGAESDADESLVRSQAEQWGLPCAVGAGASASTAPVSEDEAREARHDCFRTAARDWGARYVATAHTADDQAETILHRIVRGTGLDGLAGIRRTRELLPGVSLIRPLLEFSRQEVLEYLQVTGQPYRLDATNAELQFTRNRLRHELIPLLERDYNPRVKEALIRLGKLAGEVQTMIALQVHEIWKGSVESLDAGRAIIDCEALSTASDPVVRQVLLEAWRGAGWGLRDLSQDHWRQLVNLVRLPAGELRKVVFPGDVLIERRGSKLHLDAKE